MKLSATLTATLLVVAAPPASAAEWIVVTGHVREIDLRPTATDTVVAAEESP